MRKIKRAAASRHLRGLYLPEVHNMVSKLRWYIGAGIHVLWNWSGLYTDYFGRFIWRMVEHTLLLWKRISEELWFEL